VQELVLGLVNGRNEDILEQLKIHPVKKKLAQNEQQWKTLRHPKQLLDFNLSQHEDCTTIKQTTGRIQS
jgi:hypothetical protein